MGKIDSHRSRRASIKPMVIPSYFVKRMMCVWVDLSDHVETTITGIGYSLAECRENAIAATSKSDGIAFSMLEIYTDPNKEPTEDELNCPLLNS